MKKVFALLLVAVMAVTCLCAALSVSAEETYTDKVNLLPASEKDVSQASDNGKVNFTVSNGQLKLVRSTESGIAWPSVGFDVNKEIDLSETPMLHMVFDVDPNSTADVDEGCGVNGIITYKVGDEEKTAQLSAIAGRDVDDFRLSSDLFVKFPETGKITVVKVTLSIYASDERAAEGQAIIWKTLAFAGEGSANTSSEDSSDNAGNTETSSEAPAESNTESSAPAETSSAPAATSSTAPATSSTSKPATGDEGIIVFAVLGLVAVAGAAIAVKARR